MVDVPAVTPVTTPSLEFTVAFALLLFHTPPPVVLFKPVVPDGHTVAVPVIVPGLANALIVTELVV